jgi:hypothetical protein
MRDSDLEEAINEAKRFIKKAEDLIKCTETAKALKEKGKGVWSDEKRYKIYGMDEGNSNWSPSRTRGALKRSAIDLRQSLVKINKVT